MEPNRLTQESTAFNWKKHINEGNYFVMSLAYANIPLDNNSYWGAINPGSRYILKWDPSKGYTAFGIIRWNFTHHINIHYDHSKVADTVNPDKNVIALWGHCFRYDSVTGLLTDCSLDIGICGKLELPYECELNKF